MNAAADKAELRTRYRRERNERYLDHSFSYLAISTEFSKVDQIATYISYGDEPTTHELNNELIKSGKSLYLPRMNGKFLDWVAWNGDQNLLQPSNLSKKILEPTGANIFDPSIIELIIVPALRIDRSGYRLGQGGGFYDRALAQLSAWSIGLIHPDEISGEDLPREDFDIPLDAAATPDLILRFSQH